MGQRYRCFPERVLQRGSALTAEHDRHSMGAHHQYVLGRGDPRQPREANCAAANAGLHGATRALAVEVASRGITANVVAPGIIDSEMASGFSQEQINAMVPMKRAGRAQEVAAMVGFLASDDAGYVSGQIIGVNGGMV